jgi:hypothetical protein
MVEIAGSNPAETIEKQAAVSRQRAAKIIPQCLPSQQLNLLPADRCLLPADSLRSGLELVSSTVS